MSSSKGKKTSRPSRSAAASASHSPSPSPSSHSRSPKTPSTPAREPDSSGGGGDESRLLHLLSAASAKYPNLIRDSALCARVSDSDPSPSKDNQAKLWLSHAAMVSASITPGSLVLVSIPASPKRNSDESPLASLADEDNGTASGLGHYFAVATVFPSAKIIKEGAKLSWSLSCTMGFPDTGRAIFVSAINSESQRFQFRDCKELYLNMVPQNDGPAAGGNVIAAPGALSPKTPSSSSRSRFSSPGDSPLRSGKSQESLRSMDYSSTRWDTTAARLALEDEKVNELLRIHAARWLYGRRLLVGNLVTVPICGQPCAFRVEGADSAIGGSGGFDGGDAALLVGTGTRVLLRDPKSSTERNPIRGSLVIGDPAVNSAKGKEAGHIRRLGGLSKEYTALKEIITFSFESKNSLSRYKGVLLHGPPGTGKTSLASCCARDTGVTLFSINGPEIVSQYYGESEQALHGIFDSAKKDSPAVVFIDELDAIAPARKDGGEELSLRMVATLLKLMDDINIDDNVLVIAATNRPDSIDPALRRPGRLDKEIEIGVPSPDQRSDILQTLLSGMDHSLNNTEIQSLAFATHGFVGADLAALCNEAAMIALRRHIKLKSSGNYIKELSAGQNGSGIDMHHTDVCKDEQCPSGDGMVSLLTSLSELTVSSKPTYPVNFHGVREHYSTPPCGLYEAHKGGNEMLLKVTAVDFEKAKMKVRPSAMREVLIELPKVRWEDVGGQSNVKKQLIEAVQWPQICPDAFERIGIRPPRGLLMIGPPGCSKTLMARAVASEAKLNFLAVKGPELFSKWVGESEKAVKSLFAKARENSPAIIFFDEIDGLAVTRGEENDGTSVADRVLSQLLVEMDGLDQRINVTVIAATNRPDKIDHALLRPGRFDRLLDVQPPDQSDREDIFRIHMRDIPCSSSVSAKDLATLTEGYTGADIKLICREAAIAALEESLDISEVSMAHFHIGIGRVQPSDVQFYKELAAQFRRFVDVGSARDE